jgi:hypothetical protein
MMIPLTLRLEKSTSKVEGVGLRLALSPLAYDKLQTLVLRATSYIFKAIAWTEL